MDQRSELMKQIDAEVLERVQKGLKFLEEKHGPGWEDKIDMRKLNLERGSVCVLGQVYAGKSRDAYVTGFDWATDQFAEELEDPSEFGFDTYDEAYSVLTEAWKIVLQDREARIP